MSSNLKRLRAKVDAKQLGDASQPAEGQKLNLGVVASRLAVTVTQMAEAAGISRTAIADLLSNKWPVRTDQAAIRGALLALMQQRGATDEEVRTLFHAFRASPECGSRTPKGADSRATEQPDSTPEEDTMLLPKQALTPLAKRHFKIFTNPFDGEVASDAAMFVGDDIAYCREAIWQCAHNGSFVALVGESGAGKTTLVQDLEARLETDARQVVVIRPGVLGMEGNDTKGKAIKSADILHAIITALDSQAVVPQSLQSRTVKAHKLLSASAQAGNAHLLVVEEAHSMPDATLKHLKRLHEVRAGRRPLLGILLVAQPELKSRLADGLRNGLLREVAQRCEIVELLPLDAELKRYVEQRCEACNVPAERLLDDKAVEQVRERLVYRRQGGAVSMCYPLAVNNLLTRALNRAAELGAPLVTKDVVASC